jgi:hypothetical protein
MCVRVPTMLVINRVTGQSHVHLCSQLDLLVCSAGLHSVWDCADQSQFWVCALLVLFCICTSTQNHASFGLRMPRQC